MATLSVSPVSPVAFGTLSALRPLQAPPIPPVQGGQTAGATALSIQDLAQTMFQRALQAATLFPVVAPATGSASLAQEATASLLASLSAPQASASTTAVPTATTNPVAVPASDTSGSTAPTSAPPAAIIGDLPATQDAFALSSSPDFAMQTALRFGAGVAAQAMAVPPTTDLGADLVRDAASVQRLGNLQPRAGGPGPEAFASPQAALQRVLRSYESAPIMAFVQGNRTVDLLA